MNAQHTPGPWTAVQANRFDVLDPELCHQITGKGWGSFAIVATRMFGEDADNAEGMANARLIAAAPELLEALLEVIDETAFYQARFSTEEWCSKARAAIAKAAT